MHDPPPPGRRRRTARRRRLSPPWPCPMRRTGPRRSRQVGTNRPVADRIARTYRSCHREGATRRALRDRRGRQRRDPAAQRSPEMRCRCGPSRHGTAPVRLLSRSSERRRPRANTATSGQVSRSAITVMLNRPTYDMAPTPMVRLPMIGTSGDWRRGTRVPAGRVAPPAPLIECPSVRSGQTRPCRPRRRARTEADEEGDDREDPRTDRPPVPYASYAASRTAVLRGEGRSVTAPLHRAPDSVRPRRSSASHASPRRRTCSRRALGAGTSSSEV